MGQKGTVLEYIAIDGRRLWLRKLSQITTRDLERAGIDIPLLFFQWLVQENYIQPTKKVSTSPTDRKTAYYDMGDIRFQLSQLDLKKLGHVYRSNAPASQTQDDEIDSDRIRMICNNPRCRHTFNIHKSAVRKGIRCRSCGGKVHIYRSKSHTRKGDQRPVPETSQQNTIEQLVSKQDRASFRNYKSLHSGRDEYTYMKLNDLRNLIGDTDARLVREAHLDDKRTASTFRWILRGLPVDMAIRKVKTDSTVSKEARKSMAKRRWG